MRRKGGAPGGFDGFVVAGVGVAAVLRCGGVDGFGDPGGIPISLARPGRWTVGAGGAIRQTSSAQWSRFAALDFGNEAAVAGLSQFDWLGRGDGPLGLVRHRSVVWMQEVGSGNRWWVFVSMVGGSGGKGQVFWEASINDLQGSGPPVV